MIAKEKIMEMEEAGETGEMEETGPAELAREEKLDGLSFSSC
jgi:hypothetical protein